MSLNFTAIDFETANEQRASVCAVGLTTARDNQIVDVQSWLVRPPGDLRFTNTHIHGIDANDVRDAHSWATTVALIDEVADDLQVAIARAVDRAARSLERRLSRQREFGPSTIDGGGMK